MDNFIYMVIIEIYFRQGMFRARLEHIHFESEKNQEVVLFIKGFGLYLSQFVQKP